MIYFFQFLSVTYWYEGLSFIEWNYLLKIPMNTYINNTHNFQVCEKYLGCGLCTIISQLNNISFLAHYPSVICLQFPPLLPLEHLMQHLRCYPWTPGDFKTIWGIYKVITIFTVFAFFSFILLLRYKGIFQSPHNLWLLLQNKLCQQLEDLHNSVSQCLPNDKCLMLQNYVCMYINSSAK